MKVGRGGDVLALPGTILPAISLVRQVALRAVPKYHPYLVHHSRQVAVMSTQTSPAVTGLHHVTAIAGDPRRNLEFYTGTLGLRLVKRSVNQDAPDTYHLFYADAEGHAGSDITFFPWPDLPPGRRGVGLTNHVSLAVSPGTLSWWSERLRSAGIETGEPTTWFGEPVLPFDDPDGLGLALVETGDTREFAPWGESPVDASRQIRGL